MQRLVATLALAAASLGLARCGYNTLQSTVAKIKAGWAEVINQ